MENYLKYIKANNTSSINNILSKTFDFVKKYIDEQGNILYNDEVKTNLKDLITLILNSQNKKTQNIYNTLRNFEFCEPNKCIKYNLFFENAALINTTNIDYEPINKIIYEIYLFGTTIYKFSDYYKYNENNLKKINNSTLKFCDNVIDNENIFNNDFTANSYKLLILGHLMRKDNIIIENPANAFMRIILEFTYNLEYKNIDTLFKDIWVNQYYIPSTPMFYNSLKKNYNMLSSCFIINVEDNIESIGNFYKKLINILKFNSGIGIILSKIRAKGRPVMNNETVSKGIFNYIKSIAILSEQFKNYSKKRNTNINITLSIDHPDILSFLDLKLSNKAENGIPHSNLFQTVSIPDEFIYRFLSKKSWYLISPEQTIDGVHLYDVYGTKYNDLYNKMINDPTIDKIEIDPSIIMNKIVNTMIQTGGPFLFFKDVINETSNFNEIINGTNLCTEILIPCNDEETACCNIMSINLKKFVNKDTKKFNFNRLTLIINKLTVILNNVINNTFYSDESCKKSNLKHRPIGIGIQGLADTLELMNMTYDENGSKFYKKVLETMYYSALKYSNELAIISPDMAKYKNYNFVFNKFYTYQNIKKNKLYELNLNNIANLINLNNYKPENEYKFTHLELSIKQFGLINSLFIALMPTSFSSGIYNNSESFEPYTNNIYKKTYYEYDIIYYNKNLVSYLLQKKYYNSQNVIKALNDADGDIEKLDIATCHKNDLKSKYKTMNDIDLETYISFNNGVDAFVDQSISFNLSVKNNCNLTILKTLIELWAQGKKTIYYYRTDLTVNPLMFDKNIKNRLQKIYPINCNTCQ